ncbi:7550_t:CDS:1, partial [Dentiscutata heterogama]
DSELLWEDMVDLDEYEEKDDYPGLWPVTYLNSQIVKHKSIPDLFDYYYENEVPIDIEYKIGCLDIDQQNQLQLLMDRYEDICAR